MASTDLEIVIRAQDQASAKLRELRGEIGGVGQETASSGSLMQRFNGVLTAFGAVSVSAGFAMHGLVGEMNQSIDQANKSQNAILGLTSVSRAFGVNADAAKAAAAALAKDGLMTVNDAATGLKNLLASHFSLDQAIVLMNRFKDSAAFNRQAALGFGDAVATATEGIKNGNSILVDNAGVTKNLSVILQEAGFSATDVGKASSDAAVRMALFNGILKETNPQLGDAARLADTFAGKQAMAAAQTTVLQQQIGTALQAALLPLLQLLTPIIQSVAEWVSQHQKLAAGIAVGMVIFLGLIAVVGAVGAAIAAVGVVVGAVGAGVAVGFAVAAAAVAAGVAWMVFNFDKVKGAMGSLRDFAVTIFRNVANIITQPFRDAFNAIVGVFNSVTSKVPGLGGVKIPNLPAFATGTRDFSGGAALVGEHGPELVTLPRGANVYSAPETRTMGGALGGMTQNNTFHVHNEADLSEALAIAAWRWAA